MPLHHYLPATYLGEFSHDNTTMPRRKRILAVGDKEIGDTRLDPAKNIAAINNLYTLVEAKKDPEIIDEIWGKYESNLSIAIEELIERRINGATWARILVPFVSAMLVRTRGFDARFTKRLKNLGIPDDILTADNTNYARAMELQRLLGPVSVAKWTVFQISGEGSLITNDIGYAPFADEPTREIGIAIPLNKTHILSIVPKDERVICSINNDDWVPNIRYITLFEDNHRQFNQVIVATAERFIFGPDELTIDEYLHPPAIHKDRPSPMALGFPSGKMSLAHEFTWHRLVPALERKPSESKDWDFRLDYEQLSKGWYPPIFFPTNLIEFPSPLRRENDTIVAEFYNPEAYFALSEIIQLELMDITENIPTIARKGLEATRDPKLIAAFNTALGCIDMDKGNFAVAHEYFAKALDSDPSSDTALVNIGTVFAKQGFHDLAQEKYKEAIVQNPDNGFAYLNLAKINIGKSQWNEAEDSLHYSLKLLPPGPSLGQAHLSLALVFENQEKYTGALIETDKALRGFLESIDIAKCWYRRSSILLKQDDTDEAQIAINTAIKHNPRVIDYHLFYSHILLEEGKSNEAIKYLDELKTSDIGRDNMGHIHNYLSKAYVESGNLPKAIQESCNATALNPVEIDFIGQLGFVYLLHGDFNEAITKFDEILEIDPSDYIANLNRGIALSARGDIKDGIFSLKRAIMFNTNDDDGSPERNLAKCYLHLNDVSSACKAQEIAETKEPKSIHNSPLAAIILAFEGYPEKALTLIQHPSKEKSSDTSNNLLLSILLLMLGKTEDAIEIARKELEEDDFPITRVEFINLLRSLGNHLDQISVVENFLSELNLS